MAIRTIEHDVALAEVWGELTYTLARLAHDPRAKRFAPTIAQLITRSAEVEQGQREAWRAEIVAQAGVDAADDGMDDTVHHLGEELRRAEGGKTDTPRYKRYFTQPRHEIIRLGLESEIARVKAWPVSLKTEAERDLQAFASRFEEDIATGEGALQDRATAAAQRADHRVRQIDRLIDDVNAARRAIYGALVQIAAAERLDGEWPNRFFRRATRTPRREALPAAPTLPG